MNTKNEATKIIKNFLGSEEKILLLTGTNQSEKHLLVLELILSSFTVPKTVLFRGGNMRFMRNNYLSPIIKLKRDPKPGRPERIINRFIFYFDSFNQVTWRSCREDIDIAIVYPIGALKFDEGDACVHNLLQKNSKKIFLVSWVDDVDFSWTSQFQPVKVKYDIEEKYPEIHQKLRKITSTSFPSRKFPKNLPQYAEMVDKSFLIQILCRTCRKGRWAKLNKLYPGKTAINRAPMGEYRAECLKCGYIATDNYNW